MRKQEIFIILITLIVWFASFRKPFWGLSYYYFYTISWYNSLFRRNLEFLHVSFYTPLISLISLLFIKKQKLIFPAQLKIMGLMFVWMCISRAANGLEILGGEYMENYYKYIFGMFLIINLVDSEERFRFFSWIAVVAFASLSFVARYHDMTTPFYFLNRNNYSLVLVSAISFALFYLTMSKSLIGKLEAGCYLLVILYSIAGANSRGGYLGAATVMLLFALNGFKMKRIIFVLIFIVYLIFNISGIHKDRFSSIFEQEHSIDVETSGGTGGQRLALWVTALKMMKENAVFGVGPGENPANFIFYATPEIRARVGGNEEGYIKAHQMFLQVGSETGLVGLGIFLMIIGMSLRDILISRKKCKENSEILKDLLYVPEALGLALLGILVSGQFGNYGYNLQIYSLLFLAPCVRKIVDEHYTAAKEGTEIEDLPVIPVKWEIPFRAGVFIIFTYISLGF